MKNYYYEESISNLLNTSCKTREEAIETIKYYFKTFFTEEELLELLIRGQIHASQDERKSVGDLWQR